MSRKNKRYKQKDKFSKNSNKILLIVENSEQEFFQKYFRKYLKDKHNILIECESSAIGGRCEITNGISMTKRINEALEKESFKSVFLMIDLKTKCHKNEQTHTCYVELKKEYTSRYKVEKKLNEQFYFFVVCNEIESWFLTINEKLNNTNNPHNDHKKEIESFFNVKGEKKIISKVLEGLNNGKYQLDFSKNTSLQHFIKKLQQFNAS